MWMTQHRLSQPYASRLTSRWRVSLFFSPKKKYSCCIFLGHLLTTHCLTLYITISCVVTRVVMAVFFSPHKKIAHVVSFLNVCSLPQHCLTLYITISCVVTLVVMAFFFFPQKNMLMLYLSWTCAHCRSTVLPCTAQYRAS